MINSRSVTTAPPPLLPLLLLLLLQLHAIFTFTVTEVSTDDLRLTCEARCEKEMKSHEVMVFCEMSSRYHCSRRFYLLCLSTDDSSCSWISLEENCAAWPLVSNSSDCGQLREVVKEHSKTWCSKRVKRWSPEQRSSRPSKHRAGRRHHTMLRMAEDDEPAAAAAASSSGADAGSSGVPKVSMSSASSGPGSVAYAFDGEKMVVSHGENGGPAVATSGNAHAFSSNGNIAVESVDGGPAVPVDVGGMGQVSVAGGGAVASSSQGGAAVITGPGGVNVVSSGGPSQTVVGTNGQTVMTSGNAVAVSSDGSGNTVISSGPGGQIKLGPDYDVDIFASLGLQHPVHMLRGRASALGLPYTSHGVSTLSENMYKYPIYQMPVMPVLPAMPDYVFQGFGNLQPQNRPRLRPVGKYSKGGIVRKTKITQQEIEDYYDNYEQGRTQPPVTLPRVKSRKQWHRSGRYRRQVTIVRRSTSSCRNTAGEWMEVFLSSANQDTRVYAACQYILRDACTKKQMLRCDKQGRIQCAWETLHHEACRDHVRTALDLQQCLDNLANTH